MRFFPRCFLFLVILSSWLNRSTTSTNSGANTSSSSPCVKLNTSSGSSSSAKAPSWRCPASISRALVAPEKEAALADLTPSKRRIVRCSHLVRSLPRRQNKNNELLCKDSQRQLQAGNAYKKKPPPMSYILRDTGPLINPTNFIHTINYPPSPCTHKQSSPPPPLR